MIRFVALSALTLAALGSASLPAAAASFDCGKATTPFERAICGEPDLSKADERLALTYATAVGGLSEKALGEMRQGQREWLAYAQRACTRDAQPMAAGSYDERGLSCLLDLFNARSAVLEQSRIVDGLRFYPMARYEAMPDSYEADNPDSYYPVAQHELAFVQLDLGPEFAGVFNDLVKTEALAMSPGLADNADESEDDNSSDTTNSLFLDAVAGTGRITLEANTYWYGHGAAHGNWGIGHYHYLTGPGRWLEAADLFSGDGWEKALLDLAVAAAKAEHGDNLMLDDTSYIADAVVDPQRWDLSDPYALVIQFQPYEIAAYAYGAPSVQVRWDDLEPYLSDSAQEIRYGF